MDFKYEMVVPNEDLPCKFFIFEGKNGNYRRANHWHQSVEIFLVLEGELKFYINNQSQPLSAGELIIVNSNEAVDELNHLLSQYARYIIGRMGIPYREKGISVISIAMDAPGDIISALSGKLGMLPGISTKTVYAKTT